MALIAIAGACGAGASAAEASLSVPTGGPPVTFTGSSASVPSVPSAIAAYEAAAGGADNGTTAGEQNGGFRHLTWDGLAVDGSDPGSTAITGNVLAESRSRLEPWGLELGPTQPGEHQLAGSQVAVANDGFHSVNSNVQFTPFSAPNVWAPFNSNTAELQVVAPGTGVSTPVPAQTRGLGVVFLNVTTAGTTVQYYNGTIPLLSQPLSSPTGATSFVGVLFPDSVVTRVVITLGTAQIFNFDGSAVTSTPSATDFVAGDDIVLAEPAPARPNVNATAGVLVSPVLDTFTNTASNATAVIDWGDGSRTVGAIGAASGGVFNVTGTHAYAQSGIYTATVIVNDFAGDEQSSQTTILVTPRPSTTTVTCSPSPVAVTASTICTATVADAGPGGPITPTGTVGFSSPTAGAHFAEDSGCVLGATVIPGVASCEVQFTPSQLPPAQARIEGDYRGDGAHTGSRDTVIVGVRPQRCGLRTLSARLTGHPAVLGVLVTCDARANVTISVRAVAPRKGTFKAFSLGFGGARATVTAGRPTVLVIKPPPDALSILRAASKRHQRVSLKLTLTASSHATRTTTTTRVAALRIR
jgi:hypothetical protein